MSQTAPCAVLPILAPDAVVISGVVRPNSSLPLDAAAELDAVDDVAPLVGAAHLQPAAVAAGELQEVVRLHDHVVELEEGQRLLALEPQLHRFEGQHAVDREVAADSRAGTRCSRSVVEPVGVVDHQRVAPGRRRRSRKRSNDAPDAGDVGGDASRRRAAGGSRPCRTGRRPWSCRRRSARSGGGRSAAASAAS